MSKQYILNIEEISDSTEIMYEYPRKSVSLFSYIIIALLISALTWSFIGEIDYYVKASGVVRPSEEVSNIFATISGKIEETNFFNGIVVSEGDILFKYDVKVSKQMLQVYETDIKQFELDIFNLNKLIESLNINKNLFDKANSDEESYYYIYEKYLVDVKASIEQYNNNNIDINNSINDFTLSINKIDESITKLGMKKKELKFLITKIQSNDYDAITSKKASFYYSDFIAHQTNIENINQSILDEEQKKSKIQIEKDTFINSLKNTLSNVAAEMIDNKRTKSSTQTLLNNLSKKGFSEEILETQAKLNLIISCNEQIAAKNTNITTLNKDIVQLKSTIENSVVVAPISGFVNVYSIFNKGDNVQNGTQICSIVPNNSDSYKMQIYIEPKDIADVKLDQKVKIRLSAMRYNEYGELIGTITNISSDSRTDNNGNLYYVAECTISSNSLKSKDGDIKQISSGMTGEMHIVTKQRKIFHWIMEKLIF